MEAGVQAVPVSRYMSCNLRKCRPVSLGREDCARVCQFAVCRIGDRYDLKNVLDPVRYFLPWKMLPRRWHRTVLGLLSGDRIRAICPTLLAQAFQYVRYPILPLVFKEW